MSPPAHAHTHTHKGSQEQRKEQNPQGIQKTVNKMEIVSPSIPVITLNVSELNVPIKTHSLAEWINMTGSVSMLSRNSLKI